MKETIEQAAAKHFNEEIFVEGVTIQYALQEAFITGAKYQAERMYNEEEVIELLHSRIRYTLGEDYKEVTTIEWFEQFKKK
jgi:isopentenyldiphosphate isomerase